jgi:hypothetical protein
MDHKMLYPISAVQLIKLPYDFADNGDLVVMEGLVHVPFVIARVFVVRGGEGAVRGQHAHKTCTQFLTCPFGSVEVRCDDGNEVATFILNRPDVGLLVPPSIWAQQVYSVANSVLTVLCDRPYERQDYIRNYDDYKTYRIALGNP